MMKRLVDTALGLVVLFSQVAYGWWDTHIMYQKEPPRVANIEAEEAGLSNGAGAVDDKPSYGPAAGGGKAAVLKPGAGTLTWQVTLTPSTYRLFAIARVPEAEPWKNKFPEWPLFARFQASGPDGKQLGDWVMPINYLNTYYDVARFSFPAHAAGEYTLSFSITGESKTPLLVDRLDLRDELGNTSKKGFKTGRYLHTDEEVSRLRSLLYAEGMAAAGAKNHDELQAVIGDERKFPKMSGAFGTANKWVYHKWGKEALARVLRQLADGPAVVGKEQAPEEEMWKRHTEQFLKDWGEGCSRWNTTFDGRKVVGSSSFKYDSEHYLKTGDPEIGLRLATILIGIADLYPALDWSTQVWEGPNGQGKSRHIRFTFTNGRFGKIQYSMWGHGFPLQFARAYDAIFPFIQANGDRLAALARTRIPGIRNGKDLIAFLDTRLLQYVGDCVNRNRIRSMQGGSDTVLAYAVAVQGANPAGERMANWLYSRIYWDKTNDGGIQDQAVTGRLRDGSAIIGSVGYTEGSGGVLIRAADLMQRFIATGGDRRYDLSDPERFPAILAGAFLPLESRVAGGYQPLIGDWGRAHNPRVYGKIGRYADFFRFAFRRTEDPRMAWLLKHRVGRTVETDEEWKRLEELAEGQRDPQLSSRSRNLEGFGLAVLEAGVEHDGFTKKRALTFRHGVGKGHAHADSLGLEYYAHGTRAVPDAGNRGGHPHPGDMRAHLGVTVDGQTMRNTGEGNVSGTAWTTAFLPAPGTQYVAGRARFGFAPTVKRYERQVALIDVAGRDESYVFDILRVAGGREHVWSMHGPASEEQDQAAYNFKVGKAAGKEAQRLLDGHDNPQEGRIGAVARTTWPMGRAAEARMMAGAFRKDLPAVMTRSTLLGHDGALACVGSSNPKAKGHEGSSWMTKVGFLHVREAGAAGLETVWPQVIESYRGAPSVKKTELLPVQPADRTASAPLAVRVELAGGQTDLIMADGHGRRPVVAGTTRMIGRFAHVSHDARGLRLAHLVGGRSLVHADVEIQAQADRFEARIKSVDYLSRQITLDQPLPKTVKAGHELLINAPEHPQVWRIQKVEGAAVTLAHSPVLYQSEIMSVNGEDGSVVCAMNPSLLLADPRFYDGVTAANESMDKSWRVKAMKAKYIFMYLQEPVLDWAELYSLSDFPDADGDGKRTVTITNWGGGDGSPAIERVVVPVAFVDKGRQIVYFELPDNPDVVAANGWQWAGSRLMDPEKGRWMINEAGRRWIPNYAGKRNAIALNGEVSDRDFTDTDQDGRRVLRLYHFGVADTVSLTTNVVVRRKPDGTYSAEGSTAGTVKVKLADREPALISVGE